ncbi:hypothetical protein FRC19_004985 [Serendipita sp. 401]|nr:hypothetical protein FRC19_004985 [Serendipita sp. 401]
MGGYSLAITVVFDQQNETSSFLQDLRRPRKPINRLDKLGGLNNSCIITKLSGVEKRTWGFAAGISLCHKRQLLTPSTSLEVHVKTIIGCGEREAKVVVGAVVTNVVSFLVSSLKTGNARGTIIHHD